MIGMTLSLTGMTAVREMLDERQLERAVKKVTLLIERHAKEYAPVRTGRLRASIHNGQIDRLTYFVGTGVEYGIYVEFGTYKMRAQPFMRPAISRTVMEVQGNLFGGGNK